MAEGNKPDEISKKGKGEGLHRTKGEEKTLLLTLISL